MMLCFKIYLRLQLSKTESVVGDIVQSVKAKFSSTRNRLDKSAIFILGILWGLHIKF